MLGNEILHIVRLQYLYQRFDVLIILVGLCHRDDIGIFGISDSH